MIPVPEKRDLQNNSGATLLEMLGIIAVVALIAMLILPYFARGCRNYPRINCVNNLRNIGLGFNTFAAEFAGAYPWQVEEDLGGIALPPPGAEATASNNVFAFFACISNELATPKIIHCVSDQRPRPVANTFAFGLSLGAESAKIPSYFLGVEKSPSTPDSIIAGDRNLLIRSVGLDDNTSANYNRITVVSTPEIQSHSSQSFGWSTNLHQSKGNLLFGDGRVEQVNTRHRTRRVLLEATRSGTNNLHLFFPSVSN